MAEKAYFVRMRGHMEGPYGLAELRRRIRLGMVTRVHEISSDGRTWKPARQFPELFERQRPPASSGVRVSEPVQEKDASDAQQAERQAPLPSPEAVDSPPTAEPTASPVSPAVAAEPVAAEHIEPATRPAAVSPPPLRQDAGASASDELRKLCLVQGICAGAILVFCANVPHSKAGGNLVWWWGLGGLEGAILLASSLYATAVGLGLIPVAALLRGASRGWAYSVSAGLAIVLLVATASWGPSPCLALGFASLVPALIAGLICAFLLRSAYPDMPGGRALQAVAAGSVCVATLGVAVLAELALGKVLQDQARPVWAILAMILSMLGWLASIALGVLGLWGLRSASSIVGRRLAILLGLVALGMLAVAAIIVGCGVVGMESGRAEGAKFVLVQVVRQVVTVYAMSALLAVGLSEIMTSSVGSHRQRTDGVRPEPLMEMR